MAEKVLVTTILSFVDRLMYANTGVRLAMPPNKTDDRLLFISGLGAISAFLYVFSSPLLLVLALASETVSLSFLRRIV